MPSINNIAQFWSIFGVGPILIVESSHTSIHPFIIGINHHPFKIMSCKRLKLSLHQVTTVEGSLFHLYLCQNIVSTRGYKWFLTNTSTTRGKNEREIITFHQNGEPSAVHPKLHNINPYNVTHSLIFQNSRERMFIVQILLLIVAFLSLISRNCH